MEIYMKRHACLHESDARLRLYKRLYMWNRDATLQHGRAFAYVDNARYGMPTYHAQLNCKLDSPPLPKNVFNASGRYAMGFLRPSNSHKRYWDTMSLMGDMSFARDKVMVRSRQTIPAVAGMRIKAGTIQAGQYVNRDRHV
jgi:hypothetical protein